jgi:hypothetical protein
MPAEKLQVATKDIVVAWLGIAAIVTHGNGRF